jgi:hypothetical protein
LYGAIKPFLQVFPLHVISTEVCAVLFMHNKVLPLSDHLQMW